MNIPKMRDLVILASSNLAYLPRVGACSLRQTLRGNRSGRLTGQRSVLPQTVIMGCRISEDTRALMFMRQ
jgi:hypothetical protein